MQAGKQAGKQRRTATATAAMAEQTEPRTEPRNADRRNDTATDEQQHDDQVKQVAASEEASQQEAAFYKLSADERSILLNAKTSKDVKLKTRNKLSAALGRFLKSDKVNQAVFEKWSVAVEKEPHAKFKLLQSWGADIQECFSAIPNETAT